MNIKKYNDMLKKTLILLTVALIAVTSCKKEDVNHPPSKPKLLTPAKGAVVAPESITFTWEASTDAEGEIVFCSLELSSDSASWQLFEAGAGTGKTIVNKQGESSYFPFENGKKYYWKVIARSLDEKNSTTGESESDVVSFYTLPLGVANLSKTSGNGFVNLAWTDPVGLSRVEVTFSPAVSGIAQPIAVNPGVGKVELQGMENSTVYSFYVKAYNSLGHSSKVDTIKALPLSPTLVHDYDFNIYSTVQIGTQTWMRENLRATKWQDGTAMKYSNGNTYYTIGSKSDLYGLYYSSIVPRGGANRDKNPCPCGYHVPTDEDFKTLERYLGMPEEDINNTSYFFIRGEDEGVGNLLKSTTGWNDYNGANGNGVDLYGFNLLPAGSLDLQSSSNILEYGVGGTAIVYTSTENGNYMIVRSFSSAYKGIKMGQTDVRTSIRCVKD